MTYKSGHRPMVMRGVAPVLIILAVVLVSGGVYALVNRTVLKDYFQQGDKPTQEQFADVIDSGVHATDDVATPTETAPQKKYEVGDTAVHSETLYQAKILSENQKEFTLDADQSITFRWTPLTPKPQEPVTYRLKVWQLMQGQNASGAMRTNNPIVTKEVVDVTELSVAGIYTGPCRPPYLCDFVWDVEAVAKEESTDTGTGTY